MRRLLLFSGRLPMLAVIVALAALVALTSAAFAQDATPTVDPAAGTTNDDCPPMDSASGEMMMTDEAMATDEAMVGGEPFTFADDGSITVNQFPSEFETVLPGAALVTFVNALDRETGVTFYRDEVAFTSDLLASSANQTTIPMDAGTYSFSVVDSASGDAPFAEAEAVDIVDSYYYVIAAVDGSNGPELQVQEVTRADYALATGQLAEPGTVLDALNSHGLCYVADALEAAGLTDQLTGEGPFTLFVPAEFLSDEVAAMSGDLENLLLNHVVEGDLKSFDLTGMPDSLTTLAGNPLDVQVVDNAITVNGHQVLRVNIPATNGTIHVIDGILDPNFAG